ncbi:MAG: P1 family peptidase [Anaerolineaceae bacterium]|nr:P1 family peptidase [Anaerolineaceae bacterium]
MPRLRSDGFITGFLPTGALNAMTDVPGVLVGQVTLVSGEGRLQPGAGPIRTGVTAILPHGGNLFRDKVAASVHTINGYGKALGFEQVRERGVIETPILLTNTLSVWRVADNLVSYMLDDNPDIGITTSTINPVVGECNDGFLNDIQGRHITAAHIRQAIETASAGTVAEGNTGAGTGTACYQFKGGIGTASRRALDFIVGALVQTNFGGRRELRVLGVPVGQALIADLLPEPGPGSVMVVLATDAPLDARQLGRLARRAGLGLARTGTVGHDGSGDFVIAFSTASYHPHDPAQVVTTAPRFNETGMAINTLFAAVVEAVEESVLNALTAAETMTGRDGNTLHALPYDRLTALLRRYGG